VRTIEARPESTTLIYAAIRYGAREVFRAGGRSGAVITFEVETEQPLELEVAFHRDFQLEWPAAFGGPMRTGTRAARVHVGEESRRFAAILDRLRRESRILSTRRTIQARMKTRFGLA